MGRFVRIAWMLAAFAAAVVPSAPAFAQWEVKLQPGAKVLSGETWTGMNAAFAATLTHALTMGTFQRIRELGEMTYGAARAGGLQALAEQRGLTWGPELFNVAFYDLDLDGRDEMFVSGRPPLGACEPRVGCEVYVLQRDGPSGWRVLGWFAVQRIVLFPTTRNRYEIIDDGTQRWTWNGARFDVTCTDTACER